MLEPFEVKLTPEVLAIFERCQVELDEIHAAGHSRQAAEATPFKITLAEWRELSRVFGEGIAFDLATVLNRHLQLAGQ